MAGTKVPRDPNMSPEVRRFLDDLSKATANSDLATMADQTVKGNVSGLAETPSDLTATQLTTLINAFTASLKGAVPPPVTATGKFLRDDGTWATIAQTATLLNTLTASSSATLSDTTSLTATYNEYELRFRNLIPTTAGLGLSLAAHSGGAYQSANYLCTQQGSDGATTWVGAGSTAFVPLSRQGTTFPNNAGPGVCGMVRVYRPSNSTAPKLWIAEMAYNNNGGSASEMIASGYWNGGNGAVDGFQVWSGVLNTNLLTSGDIEIYGIT